MPHVQQEGMTTEEAARMLFSADDQVVRLARAFLEVTEKANDLQSTLLAISAFVDTVMEDHR